MSEKRAIYEDRTAITLVGASLWYKVRRESIDGTTHATVVVQAKLSPDDATYDWKVFAGKDPRNFGKGIDAEEALDKAMVRVHEVIDERLREGSFSKIKMKTKNRS